MLSFTSALTDYLNKDSVNIYWLLRLYYNDESNWTGLSGADKTIGSDHYYGLIKSWGKLSQKWDPYSYKAADLKIKIQVINSDNTISGGRFSDLFSTNNYANRKWELYIGSDDVAFSTSNIVGSGIILGDIEENNRMVNFNLTDFGIRWHKEIPVNTVDSATYTNAPEKNIGKPIPASYGDVDVNTSAYSFMRPMIYTGSPFPAIVTDKLDDSSYNMESKIDSVAVGQLRTRGTFTNIKDKYVACEAGNVTVTAASALIELSGNSWHYITPVRHLTGWGYGTDAVDKDLTTTETLPASIGPLVYVAGFPTIEQLGDLTTAIAGVWLCFDFGTPSGSAPAGGAGYAYPFEVVVNGEFELTWASGGQRVDITADYTSDQLKSWNMRGPSGTFGIYIDDANGPGTASIPLKEAALEIVFTPDYDYTKKRVRVPVEHTWSDAIFGNSLDATTIEEKSIPDDIDVIYCSGTFRKYGAWIDTINGNTRDSENSTGNDPGYDYGATIENPVYIIEDILRTELGLDSGTDGSDIDIESFDLSGANNTPKGYVGNVFATTLPSVPFALSIEKAVPSRKFLNKLAQMCGSCLFISGSGKYKILTRQRTTDYASADVNIDWAEIIPKKLGFTPIEKIINKIITNYHYDYATDEYMKQESATNATSQGTTVDGINAVHTLESELHTYDETTVTNYNSYLLNIYKDRHYLIDISVPNRYLHLEIGDTIAITNFPSTIKIFGNTISSSDIFMITDIRKMPKSCEIKAIGVF